MNKEQIFIGSAYSRTGTTVKIVSAIKKEYSGGFWPWCKGVLVREVVVFDLWIGVGKTKKRVEINLEEPMGSFAAWATEEI